MSKLYRIILPVTDIDLAARFYAQLLDIPGQRISPGRHYFDCGGTILACYDPVADGDGMQGGWKHHPFEYVYFAVADLERVHEHARQAGCSQLDDEIKRMPWGERMFYARDPFGNGISFVDEKTLFTGK